MCRNRVRVWPAFPDIYRTKFVHRYDMLNIAETIWNFLQTNLEMYVSREEVCSVQSFVTWLKDTKEADIGEVDSINCTSLKRPDLQNTHLLSPESPNCVWSSRRSIRWSDRNCDITELCRVHVLQSVLIISWSIRSFLFVFSYTSHVFLYVLW